MNKNNFLWIALRLIFPIIFNIIVFLTVKLFTPNFWVSYILIHFAYVMCVVSMPKNKSAVVFGYPLIYLSGIYFMIEFVVGSVFILYEEASFNVALILQMILAGIFGCIYLVNLIANNKTISDEEEIKDDILYIKSAAINISTLLTQVSDITFKRKLEKTYDSINSSQVKSYSSLSKLEGRIVETIEYLKEKVNENDLESASHLIDEVNNLLLQRNNEIKILRNQGF